MSNVSSHEICCVISFVYNRKKVQCTRILPQKDFIRALKFQLFLLLIFSDEFPFECNEIKSDRTHRIVSHNKHELFWPLEVRCGMRLDLETTDSHMPYTGNSDLYKRTKLIIKFLEI